MSQATVTRCIQVTTTRCVVCVWLALITALSLAPFAVKSQLGTMGHFHDLGHFSIFLMTALLLCWTGDTVRWRLAGYVQVCCIAVLLEALETAIYRNRFEWRDVMVDALGAAAGCAIASVIPLISPGFRNREVSAER